MITELLENYLKEILKHPKISSTNKTIISNWLKKDESTGILNNLSLLLTISESIDFSPSKLFSQLSLASAPKFNAEINPKYFRTIPFPSGLTNEHLRLAMIDTQEMLFKINHNLRESTGSPLTKYIQANNFSGIISNILTDSLSKISPYKHNHDQRYPDLKNPSNGIGLEMKASNKPGKGGESHNGHGGWHLIACYDLHIETGNIIFVHIEIAELIGHMEENDGDWHYCGSTVDSETGSQRTETYYTTSRGTSKLRDGSAYMNYDVITNWSSWRHGKQYPIPSFSPLYFQNIDKDLLVPSIQNPEKKKKWNSIKRDLFKINPNWPLLQESELRALSIPDELIKIILH